MIYAATQEIYDAFQEADMHCNIRETDDASIIVAGVNCDACTYEILYISHDNDNDVSFRIFNLVRFPENKVDAVLRAVNTCNDKYRFLKFTVDDDNSVTVSYDVSTRAENVGQIAVELCIRSMQIVDNCYPILMRAIYA